MNKEIFITILCTGLILITSFTTIATENKIDSNLTEKPDIEKLVAKLRIVIDEILQRYKHIPMVKTLCNRIIGVLDAIGLFLFCVVFGILVALPLAILMLILFFSGLTNSYLGQTIFYILFTIFFIWDYKCNFIAFPMNKLSDSLIKSISILRKVNDISELVNDCPCLQE